MEEASNNFAVLADPEKKMDKMQSSSLGDGKESLKLRISTNHADGTSKIISNHGSSSHNHNHVSKEKDGIGKDDVSKSKHGHDGDTRKDHKHKVVKDSSHREHKSHSESHKTSSDSKRHNDSNSKPKENSHISGNKDIKNKENSSSSKPKDGHNNSISKMKDSVSKSSDSKSSSVKDGSSKPKHSSSVKSGSGDQSSKPKIPSANLNHSVKENSASKEHGSSSKPKESSKHKDSSIKPKENSSSHKPKENNSSSSHKSKDNSISKPKENTSNGKPKDSSTSKPKDSSSAVKPKEGSSSNKHGDSSSKHSSSMNSSAKPKENGERSSGSSSNKPKTSADKISSSHSSKPKDASSKDRDISKLSSKSGEKLNSSSVKVKLEKPDGEKKPSKDSSDRKEVKKESSSKEKTKDVKPVHKIKQEVNDKVGDNHKINDSFKSNANVSIKSESFSEEDIPLSTRKAELKREQKTEKRYKDASDSEDEPLSARIENVKRLKKESKPSKKRKADDSDDEPFSKKSKKTVQNKKTQNQTGSLTKSPTKKKKEDEQEVWKWWEEEKLDEGVKWKSLEHKGPVFAPAYEPLPKSVKFFYNGEHMVLSPEAEEVATFYSKLLDHDYTSKEAFNKNFFKDWRKVMTSQEKQKIVDLKLCNFRQMQQYFVQKSEERKAMTKEEKLVIKKENEDLLKEYGFCIIDGHKEKIGNFKIEPPGLFRGRGEHPKMGMLKKRTMPEEVIINCSKGSKVPPPPEGHKWKEVRHDNAVTWLACWTENIQGSNKYIMLNPSSKLKGEKDMQKYEVARKLKNCVGTIRENYHKDWKSKEMRIRQRAVALYFIDKLALRAGNEKEEGETADTVGCCSLRFEHITLDEEKDGQEFVVNFDFLGKDSIRYVNSVPVEKRVFKNLQLFMENKQPGDDLFDRLNTTTLNKHLSELMDGLTAKVFRTFNASKTLQEQLDKLTNPDDPIPAKMLSYNRANRAVAILCNHQRAVPKTFDKSMENLQTKIQAKQDAIKEAKKDLKDAKKGRDKTLTQKKEKALERLKDQLIKLELSATDKEENKQIALGTSKLNYLDPRITVAWCKKWEVPIEKVYNRTQRDKFRWAIEMAGPEYVF